LTQIKLRGRPSSLAPCTVYAPPAAAVFRFAPLGAGELGLALAAGIAGILWIEGWKLYAGMAPLPGGMTL